MLDAQSNAGETSFRLLVVDDDVVQRAVICKIGSQAGFEPVGAASYDEAEHVLRNHKPDCVTLDLSLGEQSGAVLLRTIRDIDRHLPVIVISGAKQDILNSTIEVARSMALDVTGLAKPLDLFELRKLLAYRKERAGPRRVLVSIAS